MISLHHGSPQLVMMLVLSKGCAQAKGATRAAWEILIQGRRPRLIRRWEEPEVGKPYTRGSSRKLSVKRAPCRTAQSSI